MLMLLLLRFYRPHPFRGHKITGIQPVQRLEIFQVKGQFGHDEAVLGPTVVEDALLTQSTLHVTQEQVMNFGENDFDLRFGQQIGDGLVEFDELPADGAEHRRGHGGLDFPRLQVPFQHGADDADKFVANAGHVILVTLFKLVELSGEGESTRFR